MLKNCLRVWKTSCQARNHKHRIGKPPLPFVGIISNALCIPFQIFSASRLSDLLGIEDQKQRIQQNTLQFVNGGTANNVLLSGARGTGKSSLVKALLNEYAQQGLRVIQIDKQGLVDLPQIVGLVQGRAERFILYCDDLSFNADEPGYQALKATLDGDLVAFSDNLLIYATSNRRHLMPDYMQDNLATKHVGDEVHPAENVEEKVSLSERFGLWISFYPFTQDEYLAIADALVSSLRLGDMV